MTTRDSLGFMNNSTASEHRPTPAPTVVYVAYAQTTRQGRYYDSFIMQSRVPGPLL